MRCFAIVKPLGRYVLADADPVETAPGEPVESRIREPCKPNRSNWLNQISQPSRRPHLSLRRSQ